MVIRRSSSAGSKVFSKGNEKDGKEMKVKRNVEKREK